VSLDAIGILHIQYPYNGSSYLKEARAEIAVKSKIPNWASAKMCYSVVSDLFRPEATKNPET
jgi:hypothetical protein